MSFSAGSRLTLAATLAAAILSVPASPGSEAVAKSGGKAEKVRVFKAKGATKHRLTYKLTGIKGRKVRSVKLRGKKGGKTVVRPAVVRKPRPAASLPVNQVVQASPTVTVQRPESFGTEPPPPVLVVKLAPPAPVPAEEPTASMQPSPAPATTPAPTTPALPLPVPVAGATPCGPVLQLDALLGLRPPACWRPYSDASPFNRPIPAGPQLVGNSSSIVGNILSYGGAQNLVAGWAGTANDWARPTYFSRPTDPEYTLHCTKDWGPCGVEGMKVRIPSSAQPAGGGDAHLTVIDMASGWEYGLWQVTSKPAGGGRLDFSYGGRARIDEDGLGTHRLSGGVAAGWASSAGLVRAEELEAGAINHAIFITVPCDNGTWVYPAHHSGATCSTAEQRAVAPAMGQRLQLDMSSAEIRALNVPAWKKTLLRAMAEYGMVVGDTGGNAWAIQYESGVQYTSMGQPDQWVELAKKVGLRASNGAYAFNIRDGVDWAGRLRVVAPCVSDASC